jgi:hypothetical protein
VSEPLTMVPGEIVCVPVAAANEIAIVCEPSEPARMTRPFVALPPAKAVVHAAPSTLADITRVLVVIGPVDPLLPLPPHAVDTNRIDIAIAKRRCIGRSVFGNSGAAPAYIAPSCAESRHVHAKSLSV